MALLQREKELNQIVERILPREVAGVVCASGSRLAHLRGLPKTHKKKLAMRLILSATETYNYALAKWLDQKLKPLSVNNYTITDTFAFANELQATRVDKDDILVSYDVCSLFTNVPIDETIDILANKAFTDNWFNATYGLSITKQNLIELLTIATKDQLFQFNNCLYKQIDGVAMGSPLGPLMANTFLCSTEEKLEQTNQLPKMYRRYVDDTFAIMPDENTAHVFLQTLNKCHMSLEFTMELSTNNTLAFVGMTIHKHDCQLTTNVYTKPTDTGLLLHYQSHVDNRYKRSLLKTMLHRASKLSGTSELFARECDRLREVFKALKYPGGLIESMIQSFNNTKMAASTCNSTVSDTEILRIVLPFKDQKCADVVKRQLNSLSTKIGIDLQPVFKSHKIQDDFRVQENKPAECGL